MKTAICPGSFDPVTKGHMDIIGRASKMFDRVVVAIANNSHKNTIFSPEERKKLIIKAGISDNCEVICFDGLLVELLERENTNILIKGIRNIRDFEYELQMAEINKALNSKIETVFLLSRPELICVSSSNVKDICRFNGDIRPFIPEKIADEVKQRILEKEIKREDF